MCQVLPNQNQMHMEVWCGSSDYSCTIISAVFVIAYPHMEQLRLPELLVFLAAALGFSKIVCISSALNTKHEYEKCAGHWKGKNSSDIVAVHDPTSPKSGFHPLPCTRDIDCQSSLGSLSQCNRETCTCECLRHTSVEVIGGDGVAVRTVRWLAGRCYVQVRLGEECKDTVECWSIPGSATCDTTAEDEVDAGVCECFIGQARDSSCVRSPIVLGIQCSNDDDCTSIDEGTACDSVTGTCACRSDRGDLNGWCWKRIQPREESCLADEECKLAMGPHAWCELDISEQLTPIDSSFEDKGICVCDYNSFLDNRTATCVENAHLPAKNRLPDSEAEASKAAWTLPTVIILTISISLIIVGFIIMMVMVCFKRARREPVRLELPASDHSSSVSDPPPLLPTSASANLRPWEVAEEDFTIDRSEAGKLGEGRGGVVCRGHFNRSSMPVAVKTNRDLESSEIFLRAILEEARVMSYLGQHTNVVQFIGVCQPTRGSGHVYLLSELCPLGSLESFLRRNRHRFDFWSSRSNPGTRFSPSHQHQLPADKISDCLSENNLSFPILYLWAFQIASAMEYVSARKVIHSDLATRNILLASLTCVKLTDFGLSRRLYDCYTYVGAEPRCLPWKWLDYDALKFNMFTTGTDVWSFGVALWEIWTLGDIPYPGHTLCTDFMSQLLSGLHPSRPTAASDEVYQLMLCCWETEKRERPSFRWLKEQLGNLMQRINGHEQDETGYLLPV